jgi:DNA-binding transcriptional ArsR family regulator
MKWIYHHVDRRAGDGGSPVDAYRYQAKVLRALAHPVRLQILNALASQPACVGELKAMSGRRQSYVSQQLTILRAAGLVRCEKRGQQACYRLTWPEVAKLLTEVHLASVRRSEQKTAGEEAGQKESNNHSVPEIALFACCRT